MDEALRRRVAKQPGPDRRRGQVSPATDQNPQRGADPIDVSRYIAEICAELSGLASSANLGMLIYLLGMARQEAERIARTERIAE